MKIATCLVLSFFLYSCWAGGEEKVSFSQKTIQLGKVKLLVEVADSDARRSRGLMYRQKMADDHGMLFVFEKKRALSFWMKNTYIPLSIGFFDERRRLVEVLDMEPMKSVMDQQTPLYRSQSPAQYALEVNKGWFERHKIKVGTQWNWASGGDEKSGTDQGPATSGQ